MTLDGRMVTLLGSGTATPGVDVLGLIVPLGSTVDVLVFQDPTDGQLYLAYPEGPPNLLSAVAVVLSVNRVGYDTHVDAPLCFCAGTRIETPAGLQPVETLAPGDRVLTSTDGPARVLCIVTRQITTADPAHRPVVFDADSLAPGKPARRLKLSPQNRLCLPDSDPAGDTPLLGPALAFAGLPGVHHSRTMRPVRYVHVILDRHCLLRAEGVPA